MVERIKITGNKIVTRRADNSISFDTDNLYLKTDPAGTLKAGGYERCPVLRGSSTITDNAALGGFPYLTKPYGGAPAAFSDYIPKGNITLNQSMGMPFTLYLGYSSLCDITQNGNVVGNFKFIYRSSTISPQHLQQYDIYVELWGLVNITTISSFSGGLVTFNNPPNSTIYNADGTVHASPRPISNFVCAGFDLLYTALPANLSIAVTP